MSEAVRRSPRCVLFVCVENSNRSQMAEAFAPARRRHGRAVQRRLPALGQG